MRERERESTIKYVVPVGSEDRLLEADGRI